MGMNRETIAKIVNLVKTKRPDLMLLTDDVYGTFVNDFRSLLGELPHNTIGVYSYSKYFGCTGWRLGVIAIHEDNIFDKMIAKLPDKHVKALDKRYGAASRSNRASSSSSIASLPTVATLVSITRRGCRCRSR